MASHLLGLQYSFEHSSIGNLKQKASTQIIESRTMNISQKIERIEKRKVKETKKQNSKIWRFDSISLSLVFKIQFERKIKAENAVVVILSSFFYSNLVVSSSLLSYFSFLFYSFHVTNIFNGNLNAIEEIRWMHSYVLFTSLAYSFSVSWNIKFSSILFCHFPSYSCHSVVLLTGRIAAPNVATLYIMMVIWTIWTVHLTDSE